MPDFPHLQLIRKLEGDHRARGLPIEKIINPITEANLKNRAEHGESLLNKLDLLENNWRNKLEERHVAELPSLPEQEVIPLFLQIDPEDFNIESLKSFGVEIISEEEDGYVIGASSDNFASLRSKIELFLRAEPKKNHRDKAAQLWKINDGLNWKLEHILSEELLSKWDQIGDDELITVDIGIACNVRISDPPVQTAKMTESEYEHAIERWEERKNRKIEEQEELASNRQDNFSTLVRSYYGELVSSFVEYPDSFCCRIRINGKGLKDIVLTYQYLFEVVEYDPYTYHDGTTGDFEQISTEVSSPNDDAVSVCVIDSGIQSSHRLIQPAILAGSAKSYIRSDNSTADAMINGGHGTRVAGCILYPYKIPKSGAIKLPCFIENARILKYVAGQVIIPDDLYPPQLMEEIIKDFKKTELFNLSVNSFTSCRTTHMSQWAAAIDKLMFENDVLFIISAGNISRVSGTGQYPGIKEHIESGMAYPNFLLEKSSRIGSPAQSCFALTVGSICLDKYEDDDRISFGEKNSPSSFSRSGLGIWRMVKPDVVEYGGDFVRSKADPVIISNEKSISPETVRSTTGGGNAIGNDEVGTSFAAPKVTHIAAVLANEFPTEFTNFYRALIVQSARLPFEKYRNPSINDIRHFGYGIPDLTRATKNTSNRITFYDSNFVSPKQTSLYSINIPTEIRRPGEEYDVLIEVTLAFMAEPRRTRRKTSSYLSQWLSWESSKFNESFDQFSSRVVQNMGAPEAPADDQASIKWVIRENPIWSQIEGLRRQDSSLQKSWCIIKSYQLPEALSLAVVGHRGWDGDLKEQVDYTLAVSFESLNANIELYELIRIENEIPVMVEQEIRSVAE